MGQSGAEKNGKVHSKPKGDLLILSCSQRKDANMRRAPALHIYDGVNYRVLRKILLKQGWPAGLQIKIISAKYGLIDGTALIEKYEQRLDKAGAAKINKQVLRQLRKVPPPANVFVNLGEDYLPAVIGLQSVFPNCKITFAPGPIGMKMKAMKQWLEALDYRTATLKGRSSRASEYLYFFPDWDDFIYEPFSPKDKEATKGTRTYAHEICGSRIPFDGILLSLAHILVGKGALHRYTNGHEKRVPIRERLHIPKNILLFGDCGAFSYAGDSTPPFTPEEAAELYRKFGFDIGASVDHIPLAEIPVRQTDGTVRKEPLSDRARRKRMLLTRDNAEKFLQVCKRKDYRFTPLGVIQGLNTQSYVKRLHDYLDMGYKHIALGGLVPRTDDHILEILCAVRKALQVRTGGCKDNVWLHLFGILRPKLQPLFREFGVSSFDSASYFRKAWLRSNQNYLAPDGSRWYGTLRVPISTSKAMREAAVSNAFSPGQLADMEARCLYAIEACDTDPAASSGLLRAIDQYGPLLERKSTDDHFSQNHASLLNDRPWEKCSCPFCRSAGIHVVVFRGASRNKRRGLHNTWVFYHKLLHSRSVLSGSASTCLYDQSLDNEK